MRLLPFAPLTVVGAGLPMVALATHAASADAHQASGAVRAASLGCGLFVAQQAPNGSAKPGQNGVIITSCDGTTMTDRQVEVDALQMALSSGVLSTALKARTVVLADYGGSHIDTAAPLVTWDLTRSVRARPALRVSGHMHVIYISSRGRWHTTCTLQMLGNGLSGAPEAVPVDTTSVPLTGQRDGDGIGWCSRRGEGAFAVARLTAIRLPSGLQVSGSPAESSREHFVQR